MRLRRGFTLIELLVVIAIIAILAVVVVLTLNPSELLKQSRDANRLQDISTFNSALNLYNTDQSGASTYSLGNILNTAISVPDTNASTTCGSLGLLSFSTSSGQTWQCATATSSRLVNGNGWIPVNLTKISAGVPIGSLPVDPVNQTSTNLFYAYNTNGTQFEVTANLESQKYKTLYGNSVQTNVFPEVISAGTPGISSLYNSTGLLAYWSFNEGTGSSTIDGSDNGNRGTWNGTAPTASGTYYSAGKVGAYAGLFDGSSTYVNISSPIPASVQGTIIFWFNPSFNGNDGISHIMLDHASSASLWIGKTNTNILYFFWNNGPAKGLWATIPASGNIVAGTWYFVAARYNTNATLENGHYSDIQLNTIHATTSFNDTGAGLVLVPTGSTWIGKQGASSGNGEIGAAQNFAGSIDDFRIYNRVLSLPEIQAIYSAEK